MILWIVEWEALVVPMVLGFLGERKAGSGRLVEVGEDLLAGGPEDLEEETPCRSLQIHPPLFSLFIGRTWFQSTSTGM